MAGGEQTFNSQRPGKRAGEQSETSPTCKRAKLDALVALGQAAIFYPLSMVRSPKATPIGRPCRPPDDGCSFGWPCFGGRGGGDEDDAAADDDQQDSEAAGDHHWRVRKSSLPSNGQNCGQQTRKAAIMVAERASARSLANARRV